MRVVPALTPKAERELEAGPWCGKAQGEGRTEPSTMERCNFPKGHQGPHAWENLQCGTCGSEDLRLVKMYSHELFSLRTVRCVNGHETEIRVARPVPDR